MVDNQRKIDSEEQVDCYKNPPEECMVEIERGGYSCKQVTNECLEIKEQNCQQICAEMKDDSYRESTDIEAQNPVEGDTGSVEEDMESEAIKKEEDETVEEEIESQQSRRFSITSCPYPGQEDFESKGTERRGRFIIETTGRLKINSLSTLQYKKGRFNVTEPSSSESIDRSAVRQIVAILNQQNKQIDLLFDMIKNISGDEKLFHHEFVSISNDVYEMIENLKKKKHKED